MKLFYKIIGAIKRRSEPKEPEVRVHPAPDPKQVQLEELRKIARAFREVRYAEWAGRRHREQVEIRRLNGRCITVLERKAWLNALNYAALNLSETEIAHFRYCFDLWDAANPTPKEFDHG